MSLHNKRKIAVVPILIAVLIIGEGVFGGLYYKKYNDLKATSAQSTEERNKKLVESVSKVYQLPTGEDPVVLNVNKDPKEFTTDQEKAFAQTFKDLKKDDVILLYQKASVAIQYRPSEGKVIGTAPLAVNSATDVALIASTDAQALLTSSLTKALANDVRIGGKSTPVGQYTSTTVVDLTGKKSELAKKVAEAVGGSVAAAVPSAEKVPDGAEIVVLAANSVAPVTP